MLSCAALRRMTVGSTWWIPIFLSERDHCMLLNWYSWHIHCIHYNYYMVHHQQLITCTDYYYGNTDPMMLCNNHVATTCRGCVDDVWYRSDRYRCNNNKYNNVWIHEHTYYYIIASHIYNHTSCLSPTIRHVAWWWCRPHAVCGNDCAAPLVDIYGWHQQIWKTATSSRVGAIPCARYSCVKNTVWITTKLNKIVDTDYNRQYNIQYTVQLSVQYN